MEKPFQFAYGKGVETISLPEEHIGEILEGNPAPAVDVEAATLRAMRHPIGTKPLTELVHAGDKVCIVCADVTRTWNRSREFVVHIVNELNRGGVPDGDISIVFAQGTHRAQTREEDIQVVGEDVARRIRLYQHDCRDKDNLVHLGTTTLGTPVDLDRRVVEADRVILVNGVSTHIFAGYGGGRKLILPGVAGWDSIQKNHCHALSDEFGGGINPATRTTVLAGNIVSDDMQEACDMVAPCFLVHSVVNADGAICAMVAGDPHEAWLEGTKEVYRVQHVPFRQKADVTIVSAGGYPKDTNLYQGSKCHNPAAAVTKDGGIIIVLAECPELMDPPEFMGSFHYQTEADMERDLRACFTIPFFAAFNLFCLAHRYTIYQVTRKENFEEVRKTGQIPVETLEEAWKIARETLAKEGKTDYKVNILPHGGSIVPGEA